MDSDWNNGMEKKGREGDGRRETYSAKTKSQDYQLQHEELSILQVGFETHLFSLDLLVLQRPHQVQDLRNWMNVLRSLVYVRVNGYFQK